IDRELEPLGQRIARVSGEHLEARLTNPAERGIEIHPGGPSDRTAELELRRERGREARAELERFPRHEGPRVGPVPILDVELRIAAEEVDPLADPARDLELEALRLDVDAAIVGKAGALVEARVLRIVVLLGAEQRQRAEELAVEELALEAQLVALA